MNISIKYPTVRSSSTETGENRLSHCNPNPVPKMSYQKFV